MTWWCEPKGKVKVVFTGQTSLKNNAGDFFLFVMFAVFKMYCLCSLDNHQIGLHPHPNRVILCLLFVAAYHYWIKHWHHCTIFDPIIGPATGKHVTIKHILHHNTDWSEPIVQVWALITAVKAGESFKKHKPRSNQWHPGSKLVTCSSVLNLCLQVCKCLWKHACMPLQASEQMFSLQEKNTNNWPYRSSSWCILLGRWHRAAFKGNLNSPDGVHFDHFSNSFFTLCY